MVVERWNLVKSNQLQVKQWDHEYIVYHEQSGDTHMLDEIGKHMLDFLGDKSASASEIVSYIAISMNIDVELGQIQELLEKLSRFGLISVVK